MSLYAFFYNLCLEHGWDEDVSHELAVIFVETQK